MVCEGEKHDGGYSKKKKHDRGVSLPEDIVFDVLARVPAKALCRFRCVCKAWRALISDPAFVAVQRSRASPYLVGVFYGAWWPPKVRVMDMEGNVIRVFEVRVLGKDDGTNVLGVLQQATTRVDLICANNAYIAPAAGRAWTIGMDNRLAAPLCLAPSRSSASQRSHAGRLIVAAFGSWPDYELRLLDMRRATS